MICVYTHSRRQHINKAAVPGYGGSATPVGGGGNNNNSNDNTQNLQWGVNLEASKHGQRGGSTIMHDVNMNRQTTVDSMVAPSVRQLSSQRESTNLYSKQKSNDGSTLYDLNELTGGPKSLFAQQSQLSQAPSINENERAESYMFSVYLCVCIYVLYVCCMCVLFFWLVFILCVNFALVCEMSKLGCLKKKGWDFFWIDCV